MWLRIANVADIGRVNGPDQALRREHPASMMQTLYGTVVKDLIGREEAYDSFLDGAGGSLPDASSLRSLAHRRVAQEALDWANTLLTRAGARDRAASNSAGSATGASAAQAEEIDDCLALARRTYPRYRELLAWHEYQARVPGVATVRPTTKALLGAHAVRRDLKGRIRWQRWNRWGV
jgi:hypothetical protein